MRSVFVLGPRKWRSDANPDVPAWVVQALPGWWKREGNPVPWPVDIRALLVDDIRQEGHSATMMELWPRKGSELHTKKFQRIEREGQVDSYFLYWPDGGHVEGIIWELRDLVGRVLDGKMAPEALRVFPQEGVLSLDGESGLMVLGEQSHRTSYFEDILGLGCPVVPWSSYEELRLFVREHASP
jgi:hypothetical protein